MSGSGKTTIGKLIYQDLKSKNKNTVFLDGDHIREIFGNDLDHTPCSRLKNAERISYLCKYFDDEGINVVVAVLSIFPDWLAWNRSNFNKYFEIFLDVPIGELQRRDPKGYYRLVMEGKIENFVGFDIPFPRPSSPDLTITLDDMQDGVESTVNKILQFI